MKVLQYANIWWNAHVIQDPDNFISLKKSAYLTEIIQLKEQLIK